MQIGKKTAKTGHTVLDAKIRSGIFCFVLKWQSKTEWTLAGCSKKIISEISLKRKSVFEITFSKLGIFDYIQINYKKQF
jgi:hypothetical protein